MMQRYEIKTNYQNKKHFFCIDYGKITLGGTILAFILAVFALLRKFH